MLKDWKKVKSLSDIGEGWRNKKDKSKTIYINLFPFKRKKYMVIYHKEYLSPRILRQFKTKQQALKYAKAYMRKH